MRGFLLLALLILMIAASAPSEPPIAIEIVNESQYVLTELRLHDEPTYDHALNILDAPLRVGEMIDVETERPPYITFFREKYERGPILAFSTERTIDLELAPKYRVTIFDQSFRVEGIGTSESQSGCACTSLTGGM